MALLPLWPGEACVGRRKKRAVRGWLRPLQISRPLFCLFVLFSPPPAHTWVGESLSPAYPLGLRPESHESKGSLLGTNGFWVRSFNSHKAPAQGITTETTRKGLSPSSQGQFHVASGGRDPGVRFPLHFLPTFSPPHSSLGGNGQSSLK